MRGDVHASDHGPAVLDLWRHKLKEETMEWTSLEHQMVVIGFLCGFVVNWVMWKYWTTLYFLMLSLSGMAVFCGSLSLALMDSTSRQYAAVSALLTFAIFSLIASVLVPASATFLSSGNAKKAGPNESRRRSEKSEEVPCSGQKLKRA